MKTIFTYHRLPSGAYTILEHGREYVPRKLLAPPILGLDTSGSGGGQTYGINIMDSHPSRKPPAAR